MPARWTRLRMLTGRPSYLFECVSGSFGLGLTGDVIFGRSDD